MTPEQRDVLRRYENVMLMGMTLPFLIIAGFLPALAEHRQWWLYAGCAGYALAGALLCYGALRERLKHGTIFPELRGRVSESEWVSDYLRRERIARWNRRLAAQRQKEGYVYLLRSPMLDGIYKIGRTVNPDDRLSTFSVKLPFVVEYEHLIKTDDMYALEAELHAHFADKRVGGEFFKLDASEVDYIKSIRE